jgi:hypothetical protein
MEEPSKQSVFGRHSKESHTMTMTLQINCSPAKTAMGIPHVQWEMNPPRHSVLSMFSLLEGIYSKNTRYVTHLPKFRVAPSTGMLSNLVCLVRE